MKSLQKSVKDAAEAVTQQETPKKNQDSWFFWAKLFLASAFVAALIRTFWVEPYAIPTPSMLPVLQPGDYVLASKRAYGYSRHSLPFSPSLFQGRIGATPVERGDLAVFKLPRDRQSNFIKRVIGLPGDTIQLVNGRVMLNGAMLDRQAIGMRSYPSEQVGECDAVLADGSCQIMVYRETLPNGRNYLILDGLTIQASDNTRLFKVPEDHYFMMGDNRDVSQDSRKPQSVGVGYVPAENLIGRADRILFSFDHGVPFWKIWRWGKAWQGDRAGRRLRAGHGQD